jgi:hypothetical protein
MEGIDDELRRALSRYGGEKDLAAYLAQPDVYIESAPLPRGAMAAQAYVAKLDALESELHALEDARAIAGRHLHEALAHAETMGVYMAQNTLMSSFETRRRLLQGRRVQLLIQWRPIDADAFQAAITPLLAMRLEALAALHRARAGDVSLKRTGP